MKAEIVDKIRRWKDDPVTFVREVFQVDPDPWQCQILAGAPTNNRIGMKACKNPGKTAVLSWIAWWYLLTRPHPKIIATSVSGDNLSDGLWSEMAKWQQRSQLLMQEFQWSAESIKHKLYGSTWFMVARQWSKSADQTQQASTLAGKHADYMLFILDEVGSIPQSVMVAAEAALGSGIETKILIAGNPEKVEGPLYRACTVERHLWFMVEVTGDPDDPNRAPRVNLQWAKDEIAKYGRDDPWVMVNVLGKFPPSSLNALLGPDEVAAAMGRHLTEDKYEFSQKRLGVDVARFGDDRTVIFPRQGLAAFRPVELRGARTNEIAARVAMAKSKFGSELEMVDDTGGWGAGVIDCMIQGGHAPMPVNFSGRPMDARYLNKRAEMWFMMADWVKRGGALPNIPELQKELTAPTYTFANGKFKLEEKEQIKERLRFSPDLADALALTFAVPDMPASAASRLGYPMPHREQRVEHEYDPFNPARSET